MHARLETDRLVLRPIDAGDIEAIADACNDQSLARQTSRIPHPFTNEHAAAFVAKAAREWRDGAARRFAICDTRGLLGCLSLVAAPSNGFELSYWLIAAARGQGIAEEAARAAISFAVLELGAERFTAGYFADNPASAKVLEKLGFEFSGRTQTWSVARNCDVETVRVARAG